MEDGNGNIILQNPEFKVKNGRYGPRGTYKKRENKNVEKGLDQQENSEVQNNTIQSSVPDESFI